MVNTITFQQADQLYFQGTEQRNNGQGLAAVQTYQQAMELYSQLNLPEKVAACQQMIGVSYKVENDIDHAITNYHRAVELYQELGDLVNLAATYRDIGISYDYIYKYQEALPWLLKAIEVGEQAGEPANLAISQAKLGLHYLKDDQVDEAEAWMNKGLATIRQVDHWFFEMTILLGLADLKRTQKQWSEAANLLWASLAIILENNDPQDRRRAQIYGGLAQAYLESSNPDLTVKYFSKALNLIQPMSASAAALVYEDIAAKQLIQTLQQKYPDHFADLQQQVNLARVSQ